MVLKTTSNVKQHFKSSAAPLYRLLVTSLGSANRLVTEEQSALNCRSTPQRGDSKVSQLGHGK